jgi:hypothetical protein
VSSSVAASSLGQEPHFCIPKGEKSISTQEFVRLLDANLNNWTITSEPPPPTEDFGMVAILILRERFPCR